MRRVRKILLWILLILAVPIILTGGAGAAFIWLAGEEVWTAAMRAATTAASTPDQQMSVDGFRRDEEGVLRLARFSLADAKGDWLVVEDIAVELHPSHLFDHTIHLEKVTAARVELLRQPAAKADSPVPEPFSFPDRIEIPDLPVALSLEHLSIGEIILAEGVAPERTRLSASGRAIAIQESLELDIDVTPLDHGDSQLKALVSIAPGTGVLAADINASLPVIEPLLAGLSAPEGSRINLTVTGGGPLSDARLEFALSVDGVVDLVGDLRLAISAESGAVFALEAFSSLLGGAAAQPAELLGPSVGLSARATLPTPEKLIVQSLSIDAQYLSAQAKGEVEFGSGEQALEVTARLHHHPGLDTLLQGAAFRTLDLTASVMGSLIAPSINAQATVDDPRFDEFGARAINLSATAVMNDSTAAGDLSISAADPIADDPHIAALLGSKVDIRTDFSASETDVRLNDLRLETAFAHMTGDLALDPAHTLVSGRLELTAPTLTAEPQLSELMTGGNAHITLVMNKAGPTSGLVELDVRLGDLKWRDPALQALAGTTLTLAGTAGMTDATPAAAFEFAAGGGLAGRIEAALPDGEVKGSYRIALPAIPDGLAPPELAGIRNLVVQGTVGGTPEEPIVRAKLTSNDLTINSMPIAAPAVTLAAHGLTGIPDVTVQAAASVIGAPLSFATAFTMDPATGNLTIGELDLNWKSVSVQAVGNANINTLRSGIEATLRADLGEISDLAGQPLAGQLDAILSTRQTGDRTDAIIDARLAGLEADGMAVANLNAAIVFEDALAEIPGLSGDIQVAGITSGDALISSVTMKLSGSVQSPIAEFLVAASQPVEADLTARIRGDLTSPEAVSATFESLRLVAAKGEIKSRAAFVVVSRGETVELSGLDLTSSVGGRVTGNAAYAPDRISASIDVTDLGVGSLAALAEMEGFAGITNASVRVDTAGTGDKADLTFTVAGLTVPDVPTDIPFAIAVNAKWNGETATASGEISGPFERPLMTSISGALPSRPGQPLPQPPPDGRIDGAVTWQGDVARLLALLPESDHLADGAAGVDVRIGGTWSEPTMTGKVSIIDARYENLLTGTQLNSIGLDVSFNDAGAGKFNLSALGPEGGAVSGDGEVVLIGPGKGADIRIALRKLLAMRRDEVRAIVGGDTRLTWDGKRVNVHVRKVLERVDVFLAAPDLPPSVVAIELERDRVEEPEADGGPELPIDLDIQVSSPGQFFVRGRGLESEWRGDLVVTGTAGDPVIRSKFEAVRGSLALLGRDFRLDKGELGLDESFKPDFRVELARNTPDLTGRIIVSGSPASPEIAFTSEPELPQDEVLPRILFDKAKQSLSPLEAVNLAQGIRTLTNGKPGATDRIRNAVGLDVLRFEEGDSEDSAGAVSVGRYVREGVYVGAKKSVDSDAGSVVVEIDLLPNLKVDTEVGQDGGTSTGITWEKKY